MTDRTLGSYGFSHGPPPGHREAMHRRRCPVCTPRPLAGVQHGSEGGFAIGCRCGRCQWAHRQYVKSCAIASGPPRLVALAARAARGSPRDAQALIAMIDDALEGADDKEE